MAGRDVNEIREDYKELDEKAQRKKALKIMRREKLAKLRAKGKPTDDVGEQDGDEQSETEEHEPEPKKVSV